MLGTPVCVAVAVVLLGAGDGVGDQVGGVGVEVAEGLQDGGVGVVGGQAGCLAAVGAVADAGKAGVVAVGAVAAGGGGADVVVAAGGAGDQSGEVVVARPSSGRSAPPGFPPPWRTRRRSSRWSRCGSPGHWAGWCRRPGRWPQPAAGRAGLPPRTVCMDARLGPHCQAERAEVIAGPWLLSAPSLPVSARTGSPDGGRQVGQVPG